MSRLLVICGPTATGKTDLAIRMAKKFSSRGRPSPKNYHPLDEASGWNGEIISADSRQVYKGMDVGTGKNLPVNSNFQFSIFKQFSNFQIGYYEINGVNIWLYDVVRPDYQFNVADYKECADLVINDILKRGKLPILVGGTGLYIKAVVDGIKTLGVPPDWELRKRLLNCSIVELLNLLRRLDLDKWERMNESDRNNPRRLIRAIEIAFWKCEVRNEKLDKEVGSEKKNSHISLRNPASNFSPPTSVLLIGLTTPYEILYKKIDQRVEERLKNGTIDEIKKLLAWGYNFENSVLVTTIGYREWQPYFQQTANSKQQTALKKEIIDKWKFAEHAYARRQMTWFKKALRQAQGENKRINWFDISEKDWEIKVAKSVETWLKI